MDFGNRAEVVSTDRTLRIGLNSPDEVMHGFGIGTHIRPRIVWGDDRPGNPRYSYTA